MGRRTVWALAALLLVAGGVAAWLASASKSDDDAAPRTAATTSAPRAKRHAAASGGAKAASEPAKSDAPREKPDWRELLDVAIAAGAKADDVLAELGRGKPPGRALHEVLRASTEDLAKERDEKARRRAELRIRWAIEEALSPYRRDRALFAKTYREVRFGDGRLDQSGGSLVREFRFADAAKRMRDLRPLLETWCYETIAVDAGTALLFEASTWSAFRETCRQRGWDVPPPPGSDDAKRATPTEVGRRYVTPRLDAMDWQTAYGLTWIFLDLGEPETAQACLDRTKRALSDLADADSRWATWRDRLPSALDPEIRAMHDLADVAAYRIPADAAGLGAWFDRHRTSRFAHAVGAAGEIELGAWDEAMTKSFLEGGLPWAPEQWQAERARLAEAKSDSRDGIPGWTASSPNWEVFSDVSAEFSAEATLVLEAGWKQSQTALGIASDHWAPVQARIYRRRADYEAITHDHSSGHWIPGMNAVLTFLDDPTHVDFEEFRYPTLVHEATHAAVTWGVGRGVPSWMQEGLACYVARWSPVASIATNERLTSDWLSRGRSLAAAKDENRLLTLDQLLAITGKWDADDFGPITRTRYACAESLFVHLSDDAERWKTVAAWIGAARGGRDVGALPVQPRRGELAKSWSEFVDAECARFAAPK